VIKIEPVLFRVELIIFRENLALEELVLGIEGTLR
jgi:hypothetical protein